MRIQIHERIFQSDSIFQFKKVGVTLFLESLSQHFAYRDLCTFLAMLSYLLFAYAQIIKRSTSKLFPLLFFTQIFCTITVIILQYFWVTEQNYKNSFLRSHSGDFTGNILSYLMNTNELISFYFFQSLGGHFAYSDFFKFNNTQTTAK